MRPTVSNKISRFNLKNRISNFVLIFLLLIVLGQVQAQKLPFRNYTSSEGLNSNSVLSAYQTKDNRLWIGTTEGINIYDGISISDTKDLFSLPAKVIYSINEINGSLFFGTSAGLSVFNGDSLTNHNSTKDGILDLVYCTLQDNEGTIWVGTEQGLKVFNKTLSDTLISEEISSIPIYNIYQDDQEVIWFCSKQKGLFRLKSGKIEKIKLGKASDTFVGNVLQINDSTHWVCGRSGLFEIQNEKVRRLNTGMSDKIHYYDITKRQNGDIIVSSNYGVLFYNDGKFEHVSEANGLINNNVFKVLEDKEGTLWCLSLYGGMSQLINQKIQLFDPSFTHYKGVNHIIPINNHEYYLPSPEDGVIFYDSKTNSFDTLNNQSNNEVTDYFNGYYDKKENTLFLGTNDGIITFSGKKQINKPIKCRNWERIFDIEKDANGQLWLATREGIKRIINDSIVPFSNYKKDEFYVGHIYKAQNGWLYFGTELGLFIWNGKELINYSKRYQLNVGRVRQITQDKDGFIWVATNKGLFKIDGHKHQKINLKKFKDQTLYSITLGNENTLWAGVFNGILKIQFTEQDTVLRFFNQFDGFMSRECSASAIHTTEAGEIWFGTENGLLKFLPSKETDPKIDVIPAIQVKVNGIDNLGNYLDDDVLKNKHYILPTNSNHLIFSFKINHLLAGKDIKFQYMLEGIDKKWIDSENNGEITYPKLSHGEYRFLVRVLPHPNLIENNQIHELKITIKKPFYLQWWFILLCLVILITWGYSYLVIKRNVKLLNKQKGIILKQKGLVEEKNREIVDSITYAKRIQDAILPKDGNLADAFDEYFVFYRPRDIVSGDFYWVEQVDEWTIFAAADCTGHGVPGAMVSLMCSNLLRKVIVEEKETDPGKALDRITQLLLERLQGKNEKVADGMDVTLCFYNNKTKTLKFSGANNPLYHIRNGELSITKTNKQPIGYFEDKVDFTTHEITLLEGDQIVLFSDGYKDQFGGPKNKKFGAKRFNKLILDISNLNLEQQEEALLHELMTWKGPEEQVDDICIFSIRI